MRCMSAAVGSATSALRCIKMPIWRCSRTACCAAATEPGRPTVMGNTSSGNSTMLPTGTVSPHQSRGPARSLAATQCKGLAGACVNEACPKIGVQVGLSERRRSIRARIVAPLLSVACGRSFLLVHCTSARLRERLSPSALSGHSRLGRGSRRSRPTCCAPGLHYAQLPSISRDHRRDRLWRPRS